MKKNVQKIHMFLLCLVFLISSTFAWAIPAPEKSADGEKPVADYLRGDINGDGSVDVVDLTITIDIIILGTINPTDEQIKRADVDGNGMINIVDAIIIVDIILGR